MSKWFWYVARSNELMIDCDSETSLQMALKRLEKPAPSMPQLLLNEKTFVSESSPGHFHLVILFHGNLPVFERIAWQLYFMDDCFRTVQNLFRASRFNPSAPVLLISPTNWVCSGVAVKRGRFWRNPDAICHCTKENHKSFRGINFNCPAHRKLRPCPDPLRTKENLPWLTSEFL